MKKFRLSIALVLLALILTLVPAAFAQDTLGASQGDYDLWTAANAAATAANSASFSFTLSFGVSGMQNASDNSAGTLTGTGAFDKTDKANPAFQLDLTGTNSQSGKDTPITFNLRAVGGNLYYNTGSGWSGGKTADVISNLTSNLLGGASSGLTGGVPLPAVTPEIPAAGAQSAMMAQVMAFLSQLKPSDFLTLSRTDANGLAQFTLNVDMQKLISSPAMMAMAAATPEASAGSSSAFSMGAMMPMILSIFSAATVSVNEYVDPSSQTLQRAVIDFSLPLGADDKGNPTGIHANVDITLSNYNQPVSITAPDGATMIGG